MNALKQPMPEVQRHPTTLLEDIMVAAVRGYDFLISRLSFSWKWGKSKQDKVSEAVEPVEAPNGSPSPTTPDGRRRRRVLLIESDSLTRLILLDKLRRTGLEVDVAPNVGVALEKLRASYPDAIFMDLVPGGIHASEVIKEARRDPKFSTRPIYVYTCQPLNPAPASKTSVPGATRVFNKLSSAADVVVGELAADLLGGALAAAREAALPLDEEEAATVNDFPNSLQRMVVELRADLTALADKKGDANGRTAKWKEIRTRVQSLVSCTAVAGMSDLARQAAAIEAFLKELNADPDHVVEAKWHLLLNSAQVLESLLPNPAATEAATGGELTAVIVDEKQEPRAETTNFLLNTGFKTTSFAKSPQALKHLGTRGTDLLIVDSGLAELKIFLSKVCGHPNHEKTPVLFLNRSGKPQAPSKTPPVSAAAFVSQPFSGGELGLRALNLVYGSRQSAEAAPSPVLPLEQAFLEEQGVADPFDAPEVIPATEQSEVQPNEDMNRQRPKSTEGLEDIPALFSKRPADQMPAAEASEPAQMRPAAPATPTPQPPPLRVQQVIPMPQPAASRPQQAVPMPQPPPPRPQQAVPMPQPPPLRPQQVAQVASHIPDIFQPGPEVRARTINPPESQPPPPVVAAAPFQAEAPAQNDEDRNVLLQRICTSEMEIHALKSRLTQEVDFRRGLEERLKQATAASAEAEQRIAERAQAIEAQASAQIEQRVRSSIEAARHEADSQRVALEKELAQLRSEREEQQRQVEAERRVAREAAAGVEQLAQKFNQTANELERTRAEFEKQKAEFESQKAELEKAERELLESNQRQAPAAKSVKEDPTMVGAEVDELEHRVRESVSALAHITAELERERGGRRRTEQRAAALATQLQDLHMQISQHLESERSDQNRIEELERQDREREETLTRLRAELQKEVADRELAEEQLRSMGDLSTQLQDNMTLYEEARRVFQSTQDELETRLQAGLKTLSETESRLQKETSERRRLQEALEDARRNSQEQTQQSFELSRVQSALQLSEFERKRLESEVLRSRQISADSAHASRVHLNTLRRQLREPANNVYESACQLLQAELSDEQKRQVQLLLENALLLRTSVQEAVNNASDTTRFEAEGSGTRVVG